MALVMAPEPGFIWDCHLKYQSPMPRVISTATKDALELFLTNHITDIAAPSKWGKVERLHAEFKALGHEISLNYFSHAITKYRKSHGITIEHSPNKYYTPRTKPITPIPEPPITPEPRA
jgi:hypothetical protein